MKTFRLIESVARKHNRSSDPATDARTLHLASLSAPSLINRSISAALPFMAAVIN
jgi:hypothetical protein